MLLHLATLTLILLNEVKSDFISEGTWKDMKNASIDNPEEYCKNKNCIVKCCPDGHVIKIRFGNFLCHPLRIDYSEFNKNITWDDSLRKTNVSYFHFIQNDRFSDLNPELSFKFELLKNGSMMVDGSVKERLSFCVDFLSWKRNTKHKLVFQLNPEPEQDEDAKNLFNVAGMLISSFFMCLVLVVYALLPNLQNIAGKVLMAYLFSLSVGYILRALQILDFVSTLTVSFSCSELSPAFYYFLLSSFFWLNIMSFDLFWTLRGQRKCRDIHRQGEGVKFFYYSIYAWGTPLLITLLVIIVEKQELYSDSKYEPPFSNCFADGFSSRLYMLLPIGIMTLINCVLFSMTVYNIWLIKRNVVSNNESRNTKKQQNRFVIYIKLFILMGVSFTLEQFPMAGLVCYILLNSMIVLSGVFMFYMFVCKKNIILMLCKRFNIQNRFVDRHRPSNYSCVESSKCSQIKSRYSQKSSVKSVESSTLTTEI
ncbi:unnamed protein product [Arctia plantaginis]|uniref:G-protein coupled receptors family 2 profile 2 domain-containing protein n=1 Tax=Arctia plantaginis TaxID=874455 RepID=A0A8S0Z9C1_ARCPL|nr:unnamed protein product [Arctia plantaginis]